jgi:DNA-binding NtrC family response regulator
VHLPPLRERPDDIPLLASRFLQAAAAAYDREAVVLTPAAARWLQAQPWPGNVRQLQQAVERAVLVDSRDRLDVESFNDLAAAPGREPAGDSLPDVGAMTIDEIERAMILKSLRHHGGNISKVAESLGLSRPALYRRFEKYEIAV